MLSFFPDILFLAPFSAMLIRIALASGFFYSAWHRFHNTSTTLKLYGAADAVIALLLLLGLYTQLAALAGLICTVLWLFMPSWRPLTTGTIVFMLIMCLSLLVTGPGPLAFDLPL